MTLHKSFVFNNAGTKLELYPIAMLAKDFGNGVPSLETNQFNGMTLAYNTTSKNEVYDIIELTQ